MRILGWHEIRQILADALQPNVLELGAKVAGYTEEEDGTLSVHLEVSTHNT